MSLKEKKNTIKSKVNPRHERQHEPLGLRDEDKDKERGIMKYPGPRCKAVVAALLALLLGMVSSSYAQDATAELQTLQQDDTQWALPGKNFAGTRYSSLDQISTDNVTNLRVAWTFSTGVLRGHQGQPLVIGDTMYLVTPYPNIVYAIDLNNPNEIKWKFEPQNDARALGSACCDVINRGVFYAEDKIFFNTLDGHTHALDAETGELVWRVQNADPHKGETITNHPLVANDKVIVGVAGGEYGVRGFITAYDINTGERVWRWYNTGPDEEVGITARFQPFYENHKGEDLGVTTWPGDQWKLGGSTNWAWFTYDSELNLVYYGTGNPGTWNPSLRRVPPEELTDQVRWANKWSLSIMARDLDTGELAWAYQMTPHSEHDLDGTNEMILVDLEINGEMRKVLVHFDKNGFAYTVDRVTGEVLVAETFGHINWAESVDLETGLPVRNPEKSTSRGVNVENICPASMGVKDQQPAAYSPDTGLFYVPTNNLCMDYEGVGLAYTAGVPYVGAIVKMYAGPGGHRGAFIAWDAVSGQKVWEIEENFAVWGGALATGGNVVFYGTLDGWFKAVHAETGEVLWQFQTSSGIVGAPITYIGPDGKQYIAILSGVGGWPGVVVAGDISVDDPNAALGAVNAFSDLGRYTNKGGTLYVFSLDEVRE
jgi:PQQ-dependent dehydrogenase (methanol/ethanol family)